MSEANIPGPDTPAEGGNPDTTPGAQGKVPQGGLDNLLPNEGAAEAPLIPGVDRGATVARLLPPGLLTEALSSGESVGEKAVETGETEDRPAAQPQTPENAPTPAAPTETPVAPEAPTPPPAAETERAPEPAKTPEAPRPQPTTPEVQATAEPVEAANDPRHSASTEAEPTAASAPKAAERVPDDTRADDELIDMAEQVRLFEAARLAREEADKAQAEYLANQVKTMQKKRGKKNTTGEAAPKADKEILPAPAPDNVVNLADRGRPFEEPKDPHHDPHHRKEIPDNLKTFKKVEAKEVIAPIPEGDPLDPPRPELTPEQIAVVVRIAERTRFLASIADAAEKERIENLEEAEQDSLTEKFSKDKPREAESNTPKHEFVSFIASLSPDLLEAFLSLDVAEQDAAIAKSKAVKKARAEQKAETNKEGKVSPLPKERIAPETSLPRKVVEAFIVTLTHDEYAVFMALPKIERDRLINEWLKDGWQELRNEQEKESIAQLSDAEQQQKVKEWVAYGGPEFNEIGRHFMAGLSERQRLEFDKLSYSDKISNLIVWRDGGNPPGFESASERYGEKDGLQAPSYRMYGVYSKGEGEEYYQIITEHDLQRNARTNKELKKEGRTFFQRMRLKAEGMWYTMTLKVFNYEEKIAEENKHNQEKIRGIVDTGPDQYERLVFAQKHGDVYLNYEGQEVSPEVVRRAQKWALHNPSRFQALCHYELSKREEPEQAKLWQEIFDMMAHHHYNKYAMYGVVVGLQFMNKPSYLAYKNAKIEWTPLYETDEHGPVKDDNGNYKELRYTGETIYRRNAFGVKVHVLDGDGNKVKVGDVVRSTQHARFKTVDLELFPGDQEYNEKVADPDKPGSFKDKYESRYRIIRNEETGEVIRREEYKVKKIIELKHDKFAHEFAGKFMSFQYAFRSADVAIMLDEARLASQTAQRLARKGDFHSLDFQKALYTLSRYKFVVDTSRLGGSGAPDGVEGAEQMQQEQYAQAVQARTISAAEALRKQNPELSPEEAFAMAEKKLKQRGGYPPRISGTAEANVLFLELADVVDDMAEKFTNITKIRKSDMEAIQNEFFSPHGHGGGHDGGHGGEHATTTSVRRSKRKSQRLSGQRAA